MKRTDKKQTKEQNVTIAAKVPESRKAFLIKKAGGKYGKYSAVLREIVENAFRAENKAA